jgi:light-regulated signal transduction histidine kinase (bacteriophytochrome)
MSALVADLLRLSETAHVDIRRRRIDLSALAREVLDELARASPGRSVAVSVEDGLVDDADPGLLRVALANLLGNAWKFTTRTPEARVEFGRRNGPDDERAYFVRDNGPGFDSKRAHDMFHAFRRLHSATEFPGTGIGLATVKRVIDRHGGRVGAECRPGEGATFWFTLG